MEIAKKVQQTGTPDALLFVYGVWAAAALSRAAYQYLFRQPDNFMPTHISLLVGALYVLIIVGLRRSTPRAYYATLALLAAELAGVLVVGTIDVVWQPFAYSTVWSGYGAGYLFVPLVLPIAGLVWMLRDDTRRWFGVKEANR
jgi:hypothetical protein